jgi:hypothetical protein
MAVVVTHSTPADGTFSATGATAWNANHTLSGLGTMAEQDASNVNITGGSITGVTGVLTGLTVGTTTTSGGAAGQIMFDTGSVLQESSNLVWDNTNKKLTITGATVTTSQPVLDMTQTWNNVSTTFESAVINVTNTASALNSNIFSVKNSGAHIFSVYSSSVGNRNEVVINNSYNMYWTDAAGPSRGGNRRVMINASNSSSAGGINIGSDTYFGWSSGADAAQGNRDLFLTRRGAANLRFGAADAAAPVAQTLSVQSVVAGTTNTAGANLTITGSQGTGTGAGGSIIFQVAPAGSTGSAQNALSTALTIDSTRLVSVASNFYAANFVNQNNNVVFTLTTLSGATNFRIGAGSLFSISNDAILIRRAAANFQLGNVDAAAPVAQTLSVQSVVAGTTNTAGVNLTITGSQGTGTGVGGNIVLQVAPAGSSGTAQNALATAMTVRNDRTVQLTGFTVATLPAAGTAGRFAYVTDATAPVWNMTLTGGGAVTILVMDNGTNWVAM